MQQSNVKEVCVAHPKGDSSYTLVSPDGGKMYTCLAAKQT